MNDTLNIMVSQNATGHIPMALVLVVGSYLAWARRKRHPEASLLAAIALGLFLLAAFEEAMRPSVVAQLRPADVDELVRTMKLHGLINRAIVATAVGLLLWAAFGWRDPAPKTRRRADRT
jgi:hypothetical protein